MLDKDVCDNCDLDGQIHCKFNPKQLARFLVLFLIFFIPSIMGMIFADFAIYIFGWLGFFLIFFEVWEIKILCSHCPFYADEGKVLRCNANYGSLKLWKYNPNPLSKADIFQLYIGFIILFGYPFIFMILGKTWLLACGSLVGAFIFWTFLKTQDCPHCPNFNCPFNSVPDYIKSKFIEKNPILKKKQ